MVQRPEPRVSVVTPFYNTVDYIAEAIDSVLAQSHGNFEYLLVNNKSTDGSREVAQKYASQDSRIKLFDNDTFVSQIDNYNGALRHIGADSKYVKVVQADDLIFPDCLRDLVEVAERDPRIGLVSSYYLNGIDPRGKGLPHDTWHLSGNETCRLMLTSECFVLGTPSVVLYRGDVVRARKAFYPTGYPNSDTAAAYEILRDHDFGFVHQIESFCRTQDESITSKRASYNPDPLDYLITLEQHGRRVLSSEEFERLSTRKWDYYYRFLAFSALRNREPEFWNFHRAGLATIGRTLELRETVPKVLGGFGRLISQPTSTLERVKSRLAGRRKLPLS
ncbi:MAG TPA: glycosyltransferase [Polyangiaceae bacterium]|nr:glycosyltransferase [Polyangiaceae bacterium]